MNGKAILADIHRYVRFMEAQGKKPSVIALTPKQVVALKNAHLPYDQYQGIPIEAKRL